MAPAERIGVYPGTFDPLTVAHLAISEAAVAKLGLARLDLAISRGALGKGHLDESSIERRVAAIELAGQSRPWMAVTVTDDVLIADIATGYHAVVMGADKWMQVNDPTWYDGDAASRDEAIRRLPELLVAPRGDIEIPADVALELPKHLAEVSSTAVRQGRHEWSAGS